MFIFKNQKGLALSMSKGFTLIELLITIGILAILLSITLIAINPARQFGQANDTKRRSDITQVLNAIGQYSVSNAGNLPPEIAALTVNTTTAITSANFPNLCGLLVPTYLPALPVDPSGNNQAGITTCGGVWTTAGYQVARDVNNRITVSVAAPYGGAIQITR